MGLSGCRASSHNSRGLSACVAHLAARCLPLYFCDCQLAFAMLYDHAPAYPHSLRARNSPVQPHLPAALPLPPPIGVYSADLRKHYDLKDPAWRYDIMPEIIDGHNVADFIDPDIDAKLAELEREEEQMEAAHQAEVRLAGVRLVLALVGCCLLGMAGYAGAGAAAAGTGHKHSSSCQLLGRLQHGLLMCDGGVCNLLPYSCECIGTFLQWHLQLRPVACIP